MWTTRIEILFKDVSFLLIEPTLRGLNITSCVSSELPKGYDFNLAGKPLYRIEAEGFKGYVAAGSVSVHEDEQEYEEPSTLLST
jgi:hypothetical protein